MIVRRSVRGKISKFHSLFSLSLLAAMFAVFFFLMPDFVTSISGKIFVVVWALMAMLSFFAHGRSIRVRGGRQYVPVYGVQKKERTFKKARSTSFMGGS